MKQPILFFIFIIMAICAFAQFADTIQLNQYLRDTIKDRRPDKVTAVQIQKGLLGLSNLLSKYNGVLASSDFVNQGTANTVLHGNALGNPGWGSVSLLTDVSGTLPDANLSANIPLINGNNIFTGNNTFLGLSNGSDTDSALVITNGLLKKHAQNVWYSTGNSGTVSATNFIGTTDNIPLNFRVNNQKSGRIDNTLGSVYFGYLSGGSQSPFGITAFGDQSLKSLTTGNYNTAVGEEALEDNTSGFSNVAVGYSSLLSNTTGNNNVGVGGAAIESVTTGARNIGVGSLAGSEITTGSNNLVIGFSSASGLITGSNNTIIGSNVSISTSNLSNNIILADGSGNQRMNIDGSGNLAFAAQSTVSDTTTYKPMVQDGSGNVKRSSAWLSSSGWSLTGNSGTVDGTNFLGTSDNVPLSFRVNNVNAGRIDVSYSLTFLGYHAGGSTQTYNNSAFGTQALASNTSGQLNTAIGSNALTNNTIAGGNTAIGAYALRVNTTGYYNVAIGADALYSNTTGGNNIAIGLQALLSNSTARNNVAIGYNTMFSNTTGNNNTAIGDSVLVRNSTGISNTAVGMYAAQFNTNGNNNTSIGDSSGNSTTGSQNITIGYRSYLPSSTASYQLSIGNLIYGTGLDGTESTISSGNIGIKTKTPAFALHVNGSIGANKDSVPLITSLGASQVLVQDTTNGQLKRIDLSSIGPVVLAKGTISNASTLDIDMSGYYTSYDRIEISLINIRPVTDNVTLDMLVSSDGSSYDTAPDSYGWTYDWAIAGASGQQGNNFDTVMNISQNCGNATQYSSSGTITVFNPGSSTFQPLFTGVFTTIAYPGNVASIRFGGQRTAAQVTKAVRFLFSSGNISTAIYKVIGYRD